MSSRRSPTVLIGDRDRRAAGHFAFAFVAFVAGFALAPCLCGASARARASRSCASRSSARSPSSASSMSRFLSSSSRMRPLICSMPARYCAAPLPSDL